MSEQITLQDGSAIATIAPQRGAIACTFQVGNMRVLFMDDETLRDPTKNVRGGVPVLFPTPGKLVDDKWSYAGFTGSMKQHGFARNQAWRVTEQGAGNAVLTLESSAETRAMFPWDFGFDMSFTVRDQTLRLEQKITNKGTTAMPYGVGFHPYFQIAEADKSKTKITTNAKQAFDNVTKKTIDLNGIDLTQQEVDLHLLDHGSSVCSLVHPGGTVTLRGSEEYTHWVVWTLAGRDFVCLEPWTCPGNAINTGDRLLTLAPSASHTLSLEITAT
ncbi:MAG: galactose mutarotase [Deltaproteobacteria bacterium]|nr:galactose mutarotase [Deltaproteobacteria bacterium]